MRKPRIIISTLLVFNLLAVPTFAVMAAEAEAIRAQVIDSALTEAFENEGATTKQSTLVYIKDTIDTTTPSRAELLALNESSASLSPQSTDNEEGSSPEEIAAVQESIMKLRAANRAHYTAQNTAFAEKYIDSENVIYVSQYSPLIITSLNQTEANQLALNSRVTHIGLYATGSDEEVEEEPVVTPMADAAINSLESDIVNLIKAHTVQQYATGDGIRIGVLELGVPQAEYRDDFNVVECYPSITEPEVTPHASNVANIIHAVAPDAELYCASSNTKIGDQPVGDVAAIE